MLNDSANMKICTLHKLTFSFRISCLFRFV